MTVIAIPQRLLFVAMMGSGKSTVGHAIAVRLGWRFFDSDAQVLATTGRTVPDYGGHVLGDRSFGGHG